MKTVLLHVWERLKGFIIKAGTILFLACVVMWFLGAYGFVDGHFGLVESENSLLAMIGGAIAPIFVPLGFGNWQAVAASLSGFTAKEAIVSTMGLLANVAGDVEDAVNVAQGVQAWFPTTLSALDVYKRQEKRIHYDFIGLCRKLQSINFYWSCFISNFYAL